MNSEVILVPATGSDGEMDVIEISVSVGDDIEQDQTIVVLESDKATVEVPAPKAGKVERLLVSVGDKVKEGASLLEMLVESVPQTIKSGESNHDKEAHLIDTKVSSQAESSPNKSPGARPVASVQQVVVPDLGGSEQIQIVEVLGSIGDFIEEDQTLIVLESDKATMEIPCPVAGKLLALKLAVGDKVSTGDLIAEIETTNILPEQDNSELKIESTAFSVSSTKAASEQANSRSITLTNNVRPENQLVQEEAASNRIVHAGPSVRKFAREHGVDLAKVKPSGPRERILIDDVSAYIKSKVQLAQSGSFSQGFNSTDSPLPDFKQFGEISVSTMPKVHLKTAENMQRSWSLPHVTQFDEVDISELESFRQSQKIVADAKGIKLTPLVFMLKACSYVLKVLPQFNVSLDMAQQQIIQKHFIHIGFAVDTPHGLFVPVVRDVDKKGIWELASECQDLANKAREKKLKPIDMQGGCFTISSLGAIGGTAFTPIVNAPEVAILGVSKAQMKPIYVGDNNFEARLVLPLSLSYDHRAVNGADGARFTTLLSKVLGDIRELLL